MIPTSLEGSAGIEDTLVSIPASFPDASVLDTMHLGLKIRKKKKRKQFDEHQSTRQSFTHKEDHKSYLVSLDGVDALRLRVTVRGAFG